MKSSVEDLKSRLRDYESRVGALNLPARRMLNSAIRRDVTVIDSAIVDDVWAGLRGGGDESADDRLISDIQTKTIQGLKEKMADARRIEQTITEEQEKLDREQKRMDEEQKEADWIKENCTLNNPNIKPSTIKNCLGKNVAGDDAVQTFLKGYEVQKKEYDKKKEAYERVTQENIKNKTEIVEEIDKLFTQLVAELEKLNDLNTQRPPWQQTPTPPKKDDDDDDACTIC